MLVVAAIPLILFCLFLSSTLLSVYKNYALAKDVGLPLIINFGNHLSPFWAIYGRGLAQLCRPFPKSVRDLVRCSYFGWTFDDGRAIHEEFGPVLLHVNSGMNEVVLADAEAASSILARRKEFSKVKEFYVVLEVHGRNVNTADGDDWGRHRRLTAPCFNERISSLVWCEALDQTRSVLQKWTNPDAEGRLGTVGLVPDTQTLALHVLTYAGFGVHYPFGEGVKVRPGFTLAYRDALQTILSHLLLVYLLPANVLMLPVMPANLQKAGRAMVEFRRYMLEMLERERRNGQHGQEDGGVVIPRGNLMSALIEASDRVAKQGGDPMQGLSNDEILGNIFMFNLAGHDTTANALSYAIALLAAHPQWQTWLTVELDAVIGERESLKDYADLFPKLPRCLAILHETLRLFGSVNSIPRHTGKQFRTIRVRQKEYQIPPNTIILINNQALQQDPEIWGPDASVWRPSRWIVASSHVCGAELPALDPASAPTFFQPPAGSFIPWSDGPRNCIGKKFAQVEFVAVMVGLFQQHRVRPIAVEGTSATVEKGMPVGDRNFVEEGLARDSVMKMLTDSAIQGVALKMKKPASVTMLWEERERR